MSKARLGMMVLAAAVGLEATGCPSEPLTDDQANDIVQACCGEARGRIETVHDVESQRFRERCGACKRGNSKRECESAAGKVQSRVKEAYGDNPMPISCETMKSALEPLGVRIPSLR